MTRALTSRARDARVPDCWAPITDDSVRRVTGTHHSGRCRVREPAAPKSLAGFWSIGSLLLGVMVIRGVTAARVRRAFMVLGVLAGVLAMHALTSDHHAKMPGMASPVAMSGDGQSNLPGMYTVLGHSAAAHGDDPRPLAMTVDGVLLPDPVQASTGSMGHSAGAVCLAVLAAWVLLLLLRLVLRWLLSARFVPRSQARPLRVSSLAGRSPPWPAPSLSKLCVLRI